MKHYDCHAIEKKWQQYWDLNKTFKTPDTASAKPKFYVLDMFPYPSGNGLHVGHVEGYTATDIFARYKRMRGFDVLHPMGWDAFGLPAEQYALKTATHPRKTTKTNTDIFRAQIKGLGLSYDWDREIDTTDPDYYKWTQWIFLKLYEKGLAYESFAPVNWCPVLGTVLANEEVVDGRSEVGGHPVEKRPIRQWVLKITAYAEELLKDLDTVDWPESTKEMQRNWIGKSIGANVQFTIKDQPHSRFEVFTTRPDTLFGVSFCLFAPEHPLLSSIVAPEKKAEVAAYIKASESQDDALRSSAEREKTGVFTGSYAIHPLTKEQIPIYVTDYVLMNYGTGIVMGVPGHDERDFAFAKKYGLPILRVLEGGDEGDITKACHPGDGVLIHSQFLDGLKKDAAILKMIEWLESQKLGKRAVTFRLRDWIFSRQRYWGEPFPIAHDAEGNVVPLPASELPVLLPDMTDIKPTEDGEPPLSKAKDWVDFKFNGKTMKRETNIMPQWAGSCWYYLRFIDPRNKSAAWDPEKEKHWMPVDLYVGGVEHANLHLLYARFWHKVLFDLGLVSTREPFKKVVHPGLILGSNGEKMSKSRGNVVNPDDVIKEWGADSLRLFEMFMGPLEQVKPWQTNSISGVNRFIKRFWRMLIDEETGELCLEDSRTSNQDVEKELHKTIKKVTEDSEALRFNTGIAAMMEFVNFVYRKQAKLNPAQAKPLVLLLAPYAPHVAEELWQLIGMPATLAYEAWPKYDPNLLVEDEVILSVMVNGKARATIQVSPNATKEEVVAKAKSLEVVVRYISGHICKNEIYVAGKIINFVLES